MKTAQSALFTVATVVVALGASHSSARALTGDRNLVVSAANQTAGTPVNATPQQRMALVIGNGGYKDAPLSNAVNDARAIAQALKESGFMVILRENADQKSLQSALREFGDRLRGGGVGLFYYAGHGMQIKGRNYLIPVGSAIEREDEVAYSAVDAQAVLDKMEAAGNSTNIMILDACRNNPFNRSFRGGSTGLAQMDAPVGTLVAFATSPGAVASDGAGQNGLYTQHLLTAMRQPGSKVEDVFKQVRANVRRDSQGKQVPWEATSLEGEFYFLGGKTVAAALPDTNAAVEAALWAAVKDSRLPVELRAYLNRYPSGRFAEAARTQLAEMLPVPAGPASKPPTTAAMAAPASVAAGKLTGRLGYAAGDTWTFADDDLLAAKSSSFTHKVSSVAADGTAVINEGAVLISPEGNFKYIRSPERERFYSDSYRLVPTQLRTGFKEPLIYDIQSKYKDGRLVRFSGSGTHEVVAREQKVTPAGTFMAWRIKRLVKGTDGAGGEFAVEESLWFVPEIKRMVATDFTETNVKSGKLVAQRRTALQSFSLAGATVAAAALYKASPSLAGAGNTKPASEMNGAANVLQRNALGIAVGDRWRYQVIDRYKGEVVENYAWKVDRVLPGGDLSINNGAQVNAPDNSPRNWKTPVFAQRGTNDHWHYYPQELRVGHKESFKFQETLVRRDGGESVQDWSGTLEVKGKEPVKVPAGEFEAWRIERVATMTSTRVSGAGPVSPGGRETATLWYAPEIHSFVARDNEYRPMGSTAPDRSRVELTSFEVGSYRMGRK